MKTLGTLVVLLVAGVGLFGRGAAEDRPLAFGVLNQQSAILTAERWNPILHYVTSVSGVPLQLKMGPTVQDTDTMMGRGDFDFVYTNHNFLRVQPHRIPGDRALERRSDSRRHRRPRRQRRAGSPAAPR